MRTTLFLFCTVFSVSAAAQAGKFSTGDLKSFSADISIHNPLPANCIFPFSVINITDCRADTSKIGFIKKNPEAEGKRAFLKLVADGGLRNRLGYLLNKHYAPCFSNDSVRLLIVIKRFWADPYPNRQIQRQEEINRASVFDIYLKFEFYLEKSNWFYPIKKADTLIQVNEGDIIPGCGGITLKFCEVYGYAVAKVIEGIDFNYYYHRLNRIRNKLTKEGVDSFNMKSNRYPISDAAVLKRGVYTNFDEFRNNNPSITDFRIQHIKKHEKTMTVLYNLANKEEVRIPEFWGYCDGQNIYYRHARNPLVKTGNTFEFFANRIEYGRDYLVSEFQYGNMYVPYNETMISLEPFQIDMETGRIY